MSSGHYASSAIKIQMNRLNDEWQSLVKLLEKRTNILTASLQFHQKADEVKKTRTNSKVDISVAREPFAFALKSKVNSLDDENRNETDLKRNFVRC